MQSQSDPPESGQPALLTTESQYLLLVKLPVFHFLLWYFLHLTCVKLNYGQNF